MAFALSWRRTILGGLRIFHSRLHLQSLALESSNVRQGIQIQAFSYLALLEEGEISSMWEDTEFVLSQLIAKVVWGDKNRPRKEEDFWKRLRAVVDGAKHNVTKQKGGYVPLAENKRLSHCCAQISRLLLNRIISANDGAASLSFDDLQLLLTYLDAEESEKEKLVEPPQDAHGFFINRPDLWKHMEGKKRLSPVELRDSCSQHFAAELPGLMFDWLAYEDRLWELAGKLKKAFDVAGLNLGKHKMQHAFESAKFTLVEIVDSTLLALRKKIRGSAAQEDVARVREAARVLSRFIVRHGDDGLKGMEEELKRATQAHLDKLPELHLKEFGTRIKKFGMDLDFLEQLVSRDEVKRDTESANAMRANTT